MINKTKRKIFRILFYLAIIFHVYIIYNYGFDYGIIPLGEFQTKTFFYMFLEIVLVILANILNYGIQFALPIWFFYVGFIKKD